MINLAAVLLEPEPVTVMVPTKVTVDGHDITQDVPSVLTGLYEVHDQGGILTRTGAEVTSNAQPRLFGANHADIVKGRVIVIGGTGTHAGKRYRLGVIDHYGSHLESSLEDV